jgi:hypothetical protein
MVICIFKGVVMDDVKVPEIDAKQLEQSLREDVERCIAAVVEAVNRARVGAVINDSEEPVREATGRLRQKIFEKAIQMKADAAQAAFSPSGKRKLRESSST